MTIQSEDLTGDVKAGIRTLWWLFLLRGVFGIIFGLLALFNGPAAVQLLAIVLGAYLLLDGIVTISAAVAERKRLGSIGWYIFQGLLTIALGVLALTFSFAFVKAIGLIIIWAIILISLIAGLIGMRISFAAKGVTKTWGWGVFANALALIVGVVLIVFVINYTDEVMSVLLVIIGIWSLLAGLAMTVWAFIARRYINEAFKSLSVTQTTLSS